MTIMNEISQFICETKYEDIPDETVAYTKALMSKIIAAMLVGANNVAGQRAIAYTKANNNSTEAGAIGTGKRFALEGAVFVNGITSHAAELEDDQFPSATSDITIFPVVFPLAEILNVSGKELITASAIGIEVMHRVGRFPLSSKGITDLPFYGVIGSAVTSAKLMNLNVDQVKSAIGIAIGRAGGYLANFGTDAHYIESAAACQDGVKAAKLAQLGMTGTWDLEGWLTHVCKGTEFDLGLITENLGSPKWRVHETWIKKYPCCFLTHRHIDMMIDIVSERSIRAEDIDHIDIHVGPVDNVCNRPSPHDTEAARFSFHHIMGAIMVDGDVDSHHFTEDGLNDDRIRSVWDKTNVICHEEWPAEFMSGTARIEVTLTDKTVVTKEALQARGGPDEPLTAKEIEALYRKYTRPVLSSSMIDKTWELVENLENLDSLKDLFQILVTPDA